MDHWKDMRVLESESEGPNATEINAVGRFCLGDHFSPEKHILRPSILMALNMRILILCRRILYRDRHLEILAVRRVRSSLRSTKPH